MRPLQEPRNDPCADPEVKRVARIFCTDREIDPDAPYAQPSRVAL